MERRRPVNYFSKFAIFLLKILDWIYKGGAASGPLAGLFDGLGVGPAKRL